MCRQQAPRKRSKEDAYHQQIQPIEGERFVCDSAENDHKKVTAVAEVQSKQSLEQTDINVLLQHLQPERHDAIKNFLVDAPSFDVVFLRKVYNCMHLETVRPVMPSAKVRNGPSWNGKRSNAE